MVYQIDLLVIKTHRCRINNMAHPFALTLYFPDGHSDGIKIIEKPNWNGSGLICPRLLLFPKHRSRPELKKPGIYILIGEDESGKRIYIGEGDPLLPRLEAHYREREWWSDVIAFTSKDQILNKAFIQFLEARLIREAYKSNRFIIENANQPNDPFLSEIERSICEGFLREIQLCLPIFGVHVSGQTQQDGDSNESTLFIHAKGITAKGFETTDGFIVKAGSYASAETTQSIPPSIKSLRQALMDQNKLNRGADGRIKFIEDHLFGSPSTASSIVLGCSSNGLDSWKNKEGVSLKTIQLKKLEQ